MASFEQAVELARKGFFIFPLIQESKLPAIEGWPEKATRDEEALRRMWIDPVLGLDQDYNIGVFTGRFGDDAALIVVDIDSKGEKNGFAAILELELAGHELPDTYYVDTPTGGRHLYYVVSTPVRQGANVLGNGVDIRSHGGFVVGPGSTVASGDYVARERGMLDAPDWLPSRCGTPDKRDAASPAESAVVEQDRAEARGLAYIATAPVAIAGQGGDQTTYRVACTLKDMGCDSVTALSLMLEWNERCQPPWTEDELNQKVANAYKYGKEAPGAAAPEIQFQSVSVATSEQQDQGEHPFAKLNKEYAYVVAGGTGNILWETTDSNGQFAFHLLNKSTVQDKLASHKFQTGKKMEPLFNAWMEWPNRRTFDGIVFEPGRDVGSRWYNMWRGFSVQPASTPDHPMVERWKEHLLENVCKGNVILADWLTSWFAHLIQKPGQKPLVALAFKGTKGTGKNALVERVKYLLGGHAMVTSRRRYLVSNFTMHLQKCLLFVLDEAFWSGDKEAEGVVKDLITGDRHVIEPKGKESYEVRNLTRVVVIGNEDWIVPATADERRWAVFEMGEGKKQDRAYFEEMRVGLDQQGGAAHLLRYLMGYRITQDVNAAPSTEALTDQKLASLDSLEKWWFNSLSEGVLLGSDFQNQWPETIGTERFRSAYAKYAKELNVRGWLPDERAIGRMLARAAPNTHKRKRVRDGGGLSWAYAFKPLVEVRKDLESLIGGPVDWPSGDDESPE